MTELTQQQLNYRIIKLEAAKRELTEELALTNTMISEAHELRSKGSVGAPKYHPIINTEEKHND